MIVALVVVTTTLTPSPDSCVPSFNHITLGAAREDEEGCSAEHLKKVPVVEIFELPTGTYVLSDVVLPSSRITFNNLEPLVAAEL